MTLPSPNFRHAASARSTGQPADGGPMIGGRRDEDPTEDEVRTALGVARFLRRHPLILAGLCSLVSSVVTTAVGRQSATRDSDGSAETKKLRQEFTESMAREAEARRAADEASARDRAALRTAVLEINGKLCVILRRTDPVEHERRCTAPPPPPASLGSASSAGSSSAPRRGARADVVSHGALSDRSPRRTAPWRWGLAALLPAAPTDHAVPGRPPARAVAVFPVA